MIFNTCSFVYFFPVVAPVHHVAAAPPPAQTHSNHHASSSKYVCTLITDTLSLIIAANVFVNFLIKAVITYVLSPIATTPPTKQKNYSNILCPFFSFKCFFFFFFLFGFQRCISGTEIWTHGSSREKGCVYCKYVGCYVLPLIIS